MQKTVDPPLRELKREAEQTRTDLTDTVEQLRTSVSNTAADLRQRISPESIKAEVTDYVRSRGERMIEDITNAARRNPMQAVAVGASVAYPLLRLARAVPLPLLMVGAGFFFAGTTAGRSATQRASDFVGDLSDDFSRHSHDVRDKIGASISAAQDVALNATDQVRRTATSAGAVVSSSIEDLQDKAASIGSDLDRMPHLDDLAKKTTETFQKISTDVTDAARDVVTSTTDAAREAAKGLRHKTDLSDRTGKIVLDTIEQNPLLIGGMGLLIGGLIASALPRTDIEESVVGEASASAKRQAQEAASRGFEAVKSTAGEIMENVARQAGAEGLTPDKLGAAAKDVGERVKRVAESAVTTAFDPDNEPKPSSGGGTSHG